MRRIMMSYRSKKVLDNSGDKWKKFRIKYTTNTSVNQLNKKWSQNVFKHAPGPRLTANCAWTPLETIFLFINHEILNTVIENTNTVNETFFCWITRHDWWFRLILVLQVFKVNLIGIKSFLGLVYLRTYVFGVFMFDRETIWHHETTNDFFEAALSLNRFVFISMIHNICWKEHCGRILETW